MRNIIILGATSGISQAVAKELLADDVCFHLVARDAEKLKVVANDLVSRGCHSTKSYLLDFNSMSGHANLVDDILEGVDSIDLLFLCYGIMFSQQECEANSIKAIEQVTSNYTSAVSLLVLFSERMLEQQYGTIAVVTSVAGDRGRKSNFIYGSAKAGLATYLEGLRYKLHDKGINVLTIKPGFIDTPMTAEIKKGALWASTEQAAKYIVKGIAKRKSIIYVPPFWFFIMMIIKLIPSFIFRKLNF